MRIVFACFPTAAGCWNPDSAATGVGGSEEAVIHMAASLAWRGHTVSVHMRAAPARRFGPVAYGDFDELEREHVCVDIAVIWRRAALLDEFERRRIRTWRRYLWLHDNVALDTLLRYDETLHKIMVLSAYHRGRYPELDDERFFVTSNGIDPSQFDGPGTPRNQRLAVYGSDYVRGLRTVLRSWPAVRRAVPGARLNVFYGWQGLERRDPTRARRLRRELDPLLGQPGVSHLGRIGHDAVAAQYRHAAVWAYPCSFRETSCISAMKAQAGGAVPAVIPNGALAETVRFGFRTALNYDQLPDAASADELAAEWQEGLVGLLARPESQERIREVMVPEATRCFDWAHVVDAWEREFASE